MGVLCITILYASKNIKRAELYYCFYEQEPTYGANPLDNTPLTLVCVKSNENITICRNCIYKGNSLAESLPS